GEFAAIDTAVPGIRISEKFPKLARLMKHASILRGMSTSEADHARARVYMHTGYKPGIGGLNYPGLGSIGSAELGQADFPVPNFVVTGTPLNKHEFLSDPGYLEPRHRALVHADPSQRLENLDPRPSLTSFDRRASVLDELEQSFAR